MCAYHISPYPHIRIPGGQEYGNKEARIPQPWRLQLPLPRVCRGFFLRMDIHRYTPLRDIWYVWDGCMVWVCMCMVCVCMADVCAA
ncbi:hypothetical protein EON63_14845 [archaeon]|nr:MAG: hypothetical protein EON63_14845 [archaeon]